MLDLQLLEGLQSLLQLGDKHYELCELASSFKSLASLNELCRKHPTTTRRTVWSNIRHYIGRLGSWSKASKIIVRVAKRRPELVENFRVKCLTPPNRINLPAADHQTRLEGVLQRMFPKNERERLEQMQVVLRSSRILNFETEFLEKYTSKNFAPRSHAEVISLEHFYVNKLEFFGNQRYIGCSKPSCYCCDLYIKFHPGNFVRRPCHGNVWANWCVPGLAIDDKRAIPWHVKRILTQMVEHVRRDALCLIMSKLPPRARVLSSTTALSTLSALSKLSINIVSMHS
jgi:OTT_1508-like deaminase